MSKHFKLSKIAQKIVDQRKDRQKINIAARLLLGEEIPYKIVETKKNGLIFKEKVYVYE